MADTKISALTALAAADVDTAADVLPIVDTGVTTTKKIAVDDLRTAMGPKLATEQASTSGTEIDFTSIPSWVKVIKILFKGVSLDATHQLRIQLGDSGGFENSGYVGAVSTCIPTASATSGTAGMDFPQQIGATIYNGIITLTLQDATDFTWVASVSIGRSDVADANVGGYYKSLSAALTQVRITTVAGTAEFDAGAINLVYE